MVLDSLSGISESREKVSRDNDKLNFLFWLNDSITQRFQEMAEGNKSNWYLNPDEVYNRVRSEMGDEFGLDDLTNFIHAVSVLDTSKLSRWIQSTFAGAVLSIVTERRAEKGLRTQYYINGNGLEFDSLFYGARFVDELFVDNFTGDRICSDIGGKDVITKEYGTLNLLVVMNCKGDNIGVNIGELFIIDSYRVPNPLFNSDKVYPNPLPGVIETSNFSGNGGDTSDLGSRSKSFVTRQDALDNYNALKQKMGIDGIMALVDKTEGALGREVLSAAEKITLICKSVRNQVE